MTSRPPPPRRDSAADNEASCDEQEAWGLLAALAEPPARRLHDLVSRLGGPTQAVTAISAGRLREHSRASQRMIDWKQQADKLAKAASANGARLLTPACTDYPRSLAAIHDPPFCLYIRGHWNNPVSVAIVGSRDCSRYGREVASRLACDLARCGITTVSGLARGIDSAAHRGALRGGGETIAVLPCGIDRIYPASNRSLAGQIIARGALVTEFALRTPAAPWRFPVRNRIIAGLALATVVVEAAVRSGARITAEAALESGREVLAVPGPITSPTSAGCNQLLSEGAHVCSGWLDVLQHLPPAVERRARATAGTRQAEVLQCSQDDLSAELRAVLRALPMSGASSFDELVQVTGMNIPKLLSALTTLESRGLIAGLGGQRYARFGALSP